ncbi:MAG: SRPBCC domain-containing protein [Tepidisphaeraceae bacterium]|jgi:uncharacterized protein YndB with AHSA1/START domain
MDKLPDSFVLNIQKELQINAPAQIVFDAIIEESTAGFRPNDGADMNMRLEPWPGGRWYRDLGNNTGHLWGHVQVIKPPKILEICGPMFMSYPVASHLQYRLTENAGVTTLSFSHRAFGEIAKEHRDGVTEGWGKILNQIKARATR